MVVYGEQCLEQCTLLIGSSRVWCSVLHDVLDLNLLPSNAEQSLALCHEFVNVQKRVVCLQYQQVGQHLGDLGESALLVLLNVYVVFTNLAPRHYLHWDI